MISEIGVVVALYIVTRMLIFYRGEITRDERFMIALTAIVALLVIIDLIFRGLFADPWASLQKFSGR